jgi:phytoene desaturase
MRDFICSSMDMTGDKTVVIGCGFGGMSTAALLAKKGYDVTIIEKNDQPGGRAIVWEEKGFVYDMGPSWYLMPDVFERFFAEFGRKVTDYYKLKRLDPNYRVFFQGRDKVDISADLEKNKRLFDTMEEGGGKKLEEYLRSASYQYDIAMGQFIYRDYRSMFDFLNKKLVFEGTKLHIFESLDGYAKRFISNPDLRKVLEYTIVFLGGTPYDSPAMYALMSHVDFNLGVFYPIGGMGALARAFHRLCIEQGVKFRFNEEVKKIDVEDGRVKGITTEKGHIPAKKVIANSDYPHTETELLEKQYRSYPEKYWSKRAIAPSAILMYLGFNKRIENLLHHNLYLSGDWDPHFQTIFKKPSWPDNPSYYICCPSKTDPTVAPKGSENVFILIPVAAGLKDTDEVREHYFEWVMSHMEGLTGEKIRDNLVVKRLFSHRDFSSYYNAYKGTALGLAHTLRQTAVFRPAQRSRKVKDLYYSGQYTHPGIGVPMVIIGSQILAKDVVS